MCDKCITEIQHLEILRLFSVSERNTVVSNEDSDGLRANNNGVTSVVPRSSNIRPARRSNPDSSSNRRTNSQPAVRSDYTASSSTALPVSRSRSNSSEDADEYLFRDLNNSNYVRELSRLANSPVHRANRSGSDSSNEDSDEYMLRDMDGNRTAPRSRSSNRYRRRNHRNSSNVFRPRNRRVSGNISRRSSSSTVRRSSGNISRRSSGSISRHTSRSISRRSSDNDFHLFGKLMFTL